MVSYRKHGLRMAEFWLDEPVENPPSCDVLLLWQYTKPPAEAICAPFSSLILGLDAPEADLLAGLNRDTKYKVRRAENKDEITCVRETDIDETTLEDFRLYYDEFAVAKGLPGVPAGQLRARSKKLCSSRAVKDGVTLAWHMHFVTQERATLLHSASQFRQMNDNESRALVGRANRWLHWKDILGFKADGLKVYDFGGWYSGDTDEALLRINQFKEGFGGKRSDQVNAGISRSVRGWIYLKLRHRFAPNILAALRKLRR